MDKTNSNSNENVVFKKLPVVLYLFLDIVYYLLLFIMDIFKISIGKFTEYLNLAFYACFMIITTMSYSSFSTILAILASVQLGLTYLRYFGTYSIASLVQLSLFMVAPILWNLFALKNGFVADLSLLLFYSFFCLCLYFSNHIGRRSTEIKE